MVNYIIFIIFRNFSLDIKKKISNAAFLKYELTQNPEFDKAFPHLAKYKPPLKIKRDTSEYDFIQSLTYSFLHLLVYFFSDITSVLLKSNHMKTQ